MTIKRTLCEICNKLVASANMARHRKGVHSYCQVCKLLVSRKRHHCFQSLDGPALSPLLDDQFLLIYVPVLIRKKMYKKLEADIAVWPLNDIGGKESEQSFLDNVKCNLRKSCLACCVSEFIEVNETDHHSCTDPNRIEFIGALSNSLRTEQPSEDTIINIYQTIFGRHGGPPDFIEPRHENDVDMFNI